MQKKKSSLSTPFVGKFSENGPLDVVYRSTHTPTHTHLPLKVDTAVVQQNEHWHRFDQPLWESTLCDLLPPVKYKIQLYQTFCCTQCDDSTLDKLWVKSGLSTLWNVNTTGPQTEIKGSTASDSFYSQAYFWIYLTRIWVYKKRTE